jgi:hypothetical protein
MEQVQKEGKLQLTTEVRVREWNGFSIIPIIKLETICKVATKS